ncbi:iron-sulfur protein NUBPL-like [Raphanus sativus]|nr:iron-sulfur protein NUBPL-like [Raphanus sativus]
MSSSSLTSSSPVSSSFSVSPSDLSFCRRLNCRQRALQVPATTELRLHGVKDIIPIASGKGGVGKSSTAVTLAVALANKLKLKIWLLNADVYGPFVPIMMSINQKPQVNQAIENKWFVSIKSLKQLMMSINQKPQP